jgi:hypothetical protein
LFYPNGHSGWLRCDSHCLRLYTFISTPEHLPISMSLATMSSSTVSSLARRKVKPKGTVHPRTGHKGSEGGQRHSSTLSLASALNGGGWSTRKKYSSCLKASTLLLHC